jgi:hypothetical protein
VDRNKHLSIELDLRDGNLHQLGLYFVDWDRVGLVQSVEIQDAATGETLDRQVISEFQSSYYALWLVRGHVRIVVSSSSTQGPIVSGIFLDPSNNLSPMVSVAAQGDGTFTAPTDVLLQADASDIDGVVREATFFANGVNLGQVTNSPFHFLWTQPWAGEYQIVARATDNLGDSTFSAPINLRVQLPAASATFVGSDSVNQGDWRGLYGSEGYLLVNHAEHLPDYVSKEGPFFPAFTFTWADPLLDPRALQHVNDFERVAACWVVDSELSFVLGLNDGLPHFVSVYFLDFDTVFRRQQVSLSDAQSGSQLDVRDTGAFHSGKYLSWIIRGKLRFTITRTTQGNTVASALFFDPTSIVPPGTLPKIARISVDVYETRRTLSLAWLTIPDARYQVQFRDELDQGEWIDLPTEISLDGDTAVATHQLDDGSPHKFYRVVRLP